MVHGDLRDINFLVSKDATFQLKLIDFDWAGEVRAVRYPINVNHEEIRRPASALNGELITIEHDDEMVDCIFKRGNAR